MGYKCQTNKYGRAKYHFCAPEEKCSTDYDKIPMDKRCKKFFEEHYMNRYEDELLIMDGDEVYSCFMDYNPQSKRYGWCKTKGNLYDMENLSLKEMVKDDWGFCSKDCNLLLGTDALPRLLPRRKLDLRVGKCSCLLHSSYFF